MENPRSCKFFTAQFKVKKFLLDFEEPHLIGTAQCGRLQPVYITYRLLWMLWWLAVLIYDLHNSITNDIRWPIFMTNWAYAMLTLGCILQFAASLYHVILKVDDNTKMPVFYKIVWIFYEFPSAVAIGVSLMFWFLLFEGTITFDGFAAHAVNTIYVLTDIFITGVPIRILHFFYPIIFVLVFIIFSAIYQLGFDQAPIYSIFDWENDPGMAIGITIGMFFAGLVLQMFLFFLYWIKVLIYQCCCGGEGELKKTLEYEVEVEMS